MISLPSSRPLPPILRKAGAIEPFDDTGDGFSKASFKKKVRFSRPLFEKYEVTTTYDHDDRRHEIVRNLKYLDRKYGIPQLSYQKYCFLARLQIADEHDLTSSVGEAAMHSGLEEEIGKAADARTAARRAGTQHFRLPPLPTPDDLEAAFLRSYGNDPIRRILKDRDPRLQSPPTSPLPSRRTSGSSSVASEEDLACADDWTVLLEALDHFTAPALLFPSVGSAGTNTESTRRTSSDLEPAASEAMLSAFRAKPISATSRVLFRMGRLFGRSPSGHLGPESNDHALRATLHERTDQLDAGTNRSWRRLASRFRAGGSVSQAV